MMFRNTVTVYNSYEDDLKRVLLPKLLTGVHAEITRGAQQAADGDKNTSKLLVIIPFKDIISSFKAPEEYDLLDDRSGCWTLKAGDIITIGDTGSAESYSQLAERTAVFRIESVSAFDFGTLPHWEVTAV